MKKLTNLIIWFSLMVLYTFGAIYTGNSCVEFLNEKSSVLVAVGIVSSLGLIIVSIYSYRWFIKNIIKEFNKIEPEPEKPIDSKKK